MGKIRILDCTLRDGGYCNNWQFGKRNIDKIYDFLVDARIENIEQGYYDPEGEEDWNSTIFRDMSTIKTQEGVSNLLMVNYGKAPLEKVPECNQCPDGIRVVFHKKDWRKAIAYCEGIKKKGYKVFVQPMVTNSYNQSEYYEMLQEVNKIEPFAFYIVDSFGAMKEAELGRLVETADTLLKENINLGFHGHDNSKRAFSNAKLFIEKCKHHDIYIDTSTMGMGRGAGNLSTEIFVDFCNEQYGSFYRVEPLLQMIDEVLNTFYMDSPWGYTLYYFLAAQNNCHPNYARYLKNKKTLMAGNMNEIFRNISETKKVEYDESYIEKLYREYMANDFCDLTNEDVLRKQVTNKKVLLIAPGKTLIPYKDMISKYIKEYQPLVIGINFQYSFFPVNYIFMGNLIRYNKWMEEKDKGELIVTSNIPARQYFMKIKYSDCLVDNEALISDNAGLMALRFIMKYNPERIVLAGFDGYESVDELNYFDKKIRMMTDNYKKQGINQVIGKAIQNIVGNSHIEYITPSKYMCEEN